MAKQVNEQQGTGKTRENVLNQQNMCDVYTCHGEVLTSLNQREFITCYILFGHLKIDFYLYANYMLKAKAPRAWLNRSKTSLDLISLAI